MGISKEVVHWQDAPAADYAVLGHPIAHSLSPVMHNGAYRALGLDLKYLAIDVPLEHLIPALESLRAKGYRGVNLTVPLKEATLKWTADFDETALAIGACNTLDLANRSGTNTDAAGFIESISATFLGPHRALILGAGGSASAIAYALKRREWHVSIWNRTPERAKTLANKFDLEVQGVPDLTQADLIINATPSSLQGESLHLNWSQAKPKAAAYDLAYGKDLPFLLEAKQHLEWIHDGLPMLVYQGAAAFRWWMGGLEPVNEMFAALEKELKSSARS